VTTDSDTLDGAATGDAETQTVWDTFYDTASGTVVENDSEMETDTRVKTASDTGGDTIMESGTDADTDTGVNTDSFIDTGTAADTDSVSDTVTVSDTESVIDTGTAADTDSVTDTVAVSDTESVIDTGTVSDTDSGTDTDIVGDFLVGGSLSLEEAINQSNDTPGSQTIIFEPDWTETLVTTLPILTDADGVVIIGNGTLIDGVNLNGQSPCLVIGSANVVVSGMEISNCIGEPILIQNSGSVGGNQIRDCVFRNNGKALRCDTGPGGNILGPGNLIEDAASNGIESHCDGDRIIGNEVFNSGADGISISGSANGRIIGNLVVGGVRNVALYSGAPGWKVWNNTLAYAQNVGLFSGGGDSPEVWNNIFAFSDEWAILASSIPVSMDFNLYFGNLSGNCDICSIGANAVTTDPLFIDVAGGNYIPGPGSDAIDGGTDLGLDVNGALPGNYNGTAPDIGFAETN
jgi:parallel beta-helix repeat protein